MGDGVVAAGVVARITALRADLPAALQQVADQVLANPLEAAQLRLVELAERSGTSPGTITRFCRAAGFERYAHLRLALVADGHRSHVSDWHAEVGPRIDRADPLDVLAASISSQATAAVSTTLDRVDRGAVEACAQALTVATRVDLVGMGGSSAMATELQLRLHRIGTPSWTWSDPHSALASAALLGSHGVLVAVSGSGRSLECVEVVREAARHGATTVALTADQRSPLARAASIVIGTPIPESELRADSMLRYAQLAVVDLLYLAVVQRRNEATNEALAATAAAVRSRILRDPVTDS